MLGVASPMRATATALRDARTPVMGRHSLSHPSLIRQVLLYLITVGTLLLQDITRKYD